jgi:predicted PurR-regulated permease PerM
LQSDAEMSPAQRQRAALSVLLALSFVAAVWIVAPLHLGLVLGSVMAFTAWPLFGRFAARLRRRWLAAALTTGIGGTVILAGCGTLLVVLAREIVAVVGLARGKLAGTTLDSLLGERGIRVLERLHIDRAQLLAHVQEQLGDLSGKAATAAGVVVSATAGAILTAIIALFSMYYVTLDWPRVTQRLERVLPLDPAHTRALMDEFREVARTAFVGTVATGLVQGVLAGVGFVLGGVPEAFTWGVVTIVASLVPVFGTALVWLPVTGFLLIEGRLGAAIFVGAWSLVVVMAVSDYVIRPRLVGRRSEGHPLLMLLGLLGGIQALGLSGLIVGPVVMSLFVAILRIYTREAEETPAAAGTLPPRPATRGETPGAAKPFARAARIRSCSRTARARS